MSILLLITVDVVYYCSHWVIYLYTWHYYYSVALLAVAFYVVYITLDDVESPTPNSIPCFEPSDPDPGIFSLSLVFKNVI